VGSHGVHMLGQRDSNPPLPSGAVQSYSHLGAITLNNGETLWPNFPGYTNNLQSTSGTVTPGPNGTLTCGTATGCTLAAANGQPIINPATGKQSFAYVVQTGATTFNVVPTARWNPNFAFMLSGVSALDSRYNALQTDVVRHLTNNLSAQLSYTYASCIDVSSGNWGQEGGNRIIDPYDLTGERGPCSFWTRHNLSANSLYMLPFKGRRLVEGWQVGGVFYYNGGGPFEIVAITNTGNNIGSSAPRPDYVPNAPGCNGKPINDPYILPSGVFYANPACFAVPSVGEKGNVGRNALISPSNYALNLTVQKNTRL